MDTLAAIGPYVIVAGQLCLAAVLGGAAIALGSGAVRVALFAAAAGALVTAAAVALAALPAALVPPGATATATIVLGTTLAATLAALLAIVLLPGGGGRHTVLDTAQRSNFPFTHRLRGALQRKDEALELVSEMHRHLERATRNSQISVFFQDRDLTYRWIVNPHSALTSDALLGKSDHEALPEPVRAVAIGHKNRALTTNTTQTFELELNGPDERHWFRVDVVPIADNGSEPVGVVCTAIDITRSKRLDMMRTDLSRRLAETLQRFNLALRSERILVFSQDLDLRYTWANTDDTPLGSIIGRTDEEVLPEADREAIIALKRQVIETRKPAAAEAGIFSGADRRWYDLSVEPNLRPDGTVVGVTCAAIDITHRKRNEEQMHLVMRELTHRTKNLLAVVIAIARQTSAQTSSVDDFVPALIARLRALSAAQDLIVADDWAGVYIADLIRVLIGHYVPPQSSRVSLSGPPVMLSPEASQNLGLAIHELAVNAVQYGAFANRSGTLTVHWEETEEDGRPLLRLSWVEGGGPEVSEPAKRGFGMMVIERNLSRALGAKVSMEFDTRGLRVFILLPLDTVAPLPSPDRMRLAQVS